MKTEKLNLSIIKNVLKKSELKQVMAGSGSGGGAGGPGGGGTGCGNMGYNIPCCQCFTASGNWQCVSYGAPITTTCDCYCKSMAYSYGLNDCPGLSC